MNEVVRTMKAKIPLGLRERIGQLEAAGLPEK